MEWDGMGWDRMEWDGTVKVNAMQWDGYDTVRYSALP